MSAHTMHSSVFTNYLQILMIRAIHLSLPETSDPDTKHCAVTDWRLSLQISPSPHSLSASLTQLSISILLFWLPSAQWGTFLHERSLIWIQGSWLLRLWALIKHKQDHFILLPLTWRLILKSPKWLLTIILWDKPETAPGAEEVRAYHSLSSRIWIKYEYLTLVPVKSDDLVDSGMI